MTFDANSRQIGNKGNAGQETGEEIGLVEGNTGIPCSSLLTCGFERHSTWFAVCVEIVTRRVVGGRMTACL